MELSTEYKLEQIDDIAVRLLEFTNQSNIFCFEGDLGAGKTTLIKAIATKLGIDDATVGSPSFPIINEYLSPQLNRFIYHMDFYRLSSVRDLNHLEVEEKLSSHLCFIEWPQFFQFFARYDCVWVYLQQGQRPSLRRSITIKFKQSN